MLDTDMLLARARVSHDQVTALMAVIDTNTAALKVIRLELDKCTGPDKVAAIAADVDKAMEDLSLASQKIDTWIKAQPQVTGGDITFGTVAYGQYPVADPLNPDNPVLAAEDMFVDPGTKQAGGKK